MNVNRNWKVYVKEKLCVSILDVVDSLHMKVRREDTDGPITTNPTGRLLCEKRMAPESQISSTQSKMIKLQFEATVNLIILELSWRGVLLIPWLPLLPSSLQLS